MVEDNVRKRESGRDRQKYYYCVNRFWTLFACASMFIFSIYVVSVLLISRTGRCVCWDAQEDRGGERKESLRLPLILLRLPRNI